ncbi:GPI transamidase component PIG-S-like isoform X3 [Symsagittifera roscoffensis]|uniref:GPI transamidase component PIG-S-like isoform X3 n=1 Tax=Symsagittifera roscoffensis TaxID=84072 RepID=UPI00307BE728
MNEDVMTKYYERERITTVKSSVFYLMMAVFIGFPIWWHTTTVYRAQLPEAKVNEFVSKTVQLSIPLYVSFASRNNAMTDEFKDQLTSLLQYELAMTSREQQLRDGKQQSAVKFNYDVIREDWLGERQLNEGGVEKHEKMDGYLDVVFDVLGEDQEVTLSETEDYLAEIDPKAKIVEIFIRDLKCNLEILVAKLCKFIKYRVIGEITLYNEYTSNIRVQTFDFNKKEEYRRHKKPEKLLGPKREYDLVFTLINPEPEKYDRKLIRWDIQEAVAKYLEPYLHSLRHVATFNVASQIIYQVNLGSNPSQDYGDGKVVWAFSEVDIPHLITPVERKIGFTTSNHTIINLVTYITPYEFNPCYFQTGAGDLKSLAYYKGWGAVDLHNVQKEVIDSKKRIKIDALRQIATFIPVIDNFIGLRRIETFNLARQFQNKKLSISNLDLENFYRRVSLNNLATSLSTMESLISLCDHVRNMVIRDEIKDNVEKAVSLIDEAHNVLATGGKLSEALEKSSIATELAEKAFSDPTILAMLYFPEDQKYAIYVPMFVPMSLPLWTSMGIVLGYIKSRKAGKVTVEEKQ